MVSCPVSVFAADPSTPNVPSDSLAAVSSRSPSEPLEITVIDARPDAEKKTYVLSRTLGSCEYGVWSFGDDAVTHSRPRSDRLDRILNLKLDLAAGLADLSGTHQLQIDRYNIYLNDGVKDASNRVASAIAGPIVGIAAAIGTPARAQCPRDQMTAAWFDESEVREGRPPMIVEMDVKWDGQRHLIRVAHPHMPANQPSGVLVLAAMDEANAALIADIKALKSSK
jgi:hypothetical protein